MERKLTLGRFHEVMRYDDLTGYFFWNKKSGKRAGSICHQGYRKISIDKESIYEHRLVFFVKMGRWPSIIDHIDRDTTNNRWQNLRESTASENGHNRDVSNQKKLNFDLPRGVRMARDGKRKKRFFSQFNANGKPIYCGHFATIEEAHQVYLTKIREYFPEYFVEEKDNSNLSLC